MFLPLVGCIQVSQCEAEWRQPPRNKIYTVYLCFSDGQFPSNVDTRAGTLYIIRAAQENTGVYVCVGTNRAGSDRESVEVVVRRREGEPLIIGNLPDTVDAPLNQKIELTCMVCR